jgi:hypothetical protein
MCFHLLLTHLLYPVSLYLIYRSNGHKGSNGFSEKMNTPNSYGINSIHMALNNPKPIKNPPINEGFCSEPVTHAHTTGNLNMLPI